MRDSIKKESVGKEEVSFYYTNTSDGTVPKFLLQVIIHRP